MAGTLNECRFFETLVALKLGPAVCAAQLHRTPIFFFFWGLYESVCSVGSNKGVFYVLTLCVRGSLWHPVASLVSIPSRMPELIEVKIKKKKKRPTVEAVTCTESSF